MSYYFAKRIFAAFPTLIGISILCFTLVHLTPGGPVEQLIAQWQNSGIGGEVGGSRSSMITEEQRQSLLEHFGFDKPLHVRYLHWLWRVLKFDFGESHFYSEPVLDVIKRAMPVSITFGIFSFIATYLVCIPLGILKAIHHRSLFDTLTSGIVFFLYSIPSFAAAVVLIVLFAGGSYWNFFPSQGLVSDNFVVLTWTQKIGDFLHHIFLPVTCYTLGSFASLTILLKDSMMDQLSQDYILTARAKGLSERRVVWVHALKNAILPLASGLGHWLSFFFGGSLLIETIFGLDGIGRLSFESIIRRDYPIVMANIMILSFLNIVGNLFSDLLYLFIDPRIDFKEA